MFSPKPPKPTFTSYVQPEVRKYLPVSTKKLEARLLPGEIVVNEANFVRKCIGSDSSKDDLWGKLICTNFKVSFVTHDSLPQQRFQCVHRLLGDHDIPLTCVEQVVTVNDAKGKQKVLGSNKKLKFNPTELILYCKDFRIVRFRFDEAGPESAKKMPMIGCRAVIDVRELHASHPTPLRELVQSALSSCERLQHHLGIDPVCLAIAHYSHPADSQLLFGFEYVGTCFHGSSGEKVNGVDSGTSMQTAMFDCSSDWDREIKRTGASEWRVCNINAEYLVSPSLPEFFVVPSSLADQDLKQYACYFKAQRLPLWCWNHPNGSALVRMSNITEPQQQRKLDQRICSAVIKSHPMRSNVLKTDLDKNLPNIQEIQTALVKLRQICVIEPFEESDEKWLSSMESSRWMEYVRAFLRHAVEVIYMLEGKQSSVILQEEEDRDLSCVIASLVQLMCDPHCRSLAGFQCLVQKEWVMAGHRFLDRCNHLKKNDKEESPLFLLFLNCVWQLLEQYPAAFEFTEMYLAVLSDSMWVPVFSTFLFNCPRQRAEHSRDFALSKSISLGRDKVLQFPPVWDWSQQFSLKDQTLFNNPLYVGKSAPCVHNGTVRTFTHRRSKKNYSSTLRGLPSDLKNGSLSVLDTLPRRNSLMPRLRTDAAQVNEKQDSPAEHFLQHWLSRPADLQGLLLPQLLPSHLPLWKLYFLRWVPEARIPNGGPITTFHKLSTLVDDIEVLQNQLRQYTGGSTPVRSCPSSPQDETGKMYFRAGLSQSESSSPPEYLSSSFPFSPVGNLCRRNILGTPLSKFLNGARIWLSTETLANENH